MNPEGKTALVTGGAHRVGKAISLALGQAGANLVVNYNTSAAAAEQTCSELQQLGADVISIQADLADHKQVEAMVASACEKFGTIDILVNNASFFETTPIPVEDYTAWHHVMDVLVNGPFYCANNIFPLMQKQGEGVIVNIIDLSAWFPWLQRGAHSVGKAALLALTRQLALELAPHIRVNAVAPGPVIPSPHFDEKQIERLAGKNLLKRWGCGEDVAKAVLYLIDADFVTGDVLVVDGGEQYGHLRYRFKEEPRPEGSLG
jgi:NAD(P)-dependent dehydrogenase (short-subunit alcohol dehydrogenase family)